MALGYNKIMDPDRVLEGNLCQKYQHGLGWLHRPLTSITPDGCIAHIYHQATSQTFIRSSVITWDTDIKTHSSCSRTLDPDIAFGGNLNADITMRSCGSTGHSYQYIHWRQHIHWLQHVVRLEHNQWLPLVTQATDINTEPSYSRIMDTNKIPGSNMNMDINHDFNLGHRP